MDLCSQCKGVVTPRQEALLCDTCKLWTHRTCGTGMPRQTYIQLNQQFRETGEEFTWNCSSCFREPTSVQDIETECVVDDFVAMETDIQVNQRPTTPQRINLLDLQPEPNVSPINFHNFSTNNDSYTELLHDTSILSNKSAPV